MNEIYLVRHGETLWNLEGRIQGHRDSDLTPLGLRQAEAVAQTLKERKIRAIYSSSLGRALKTAAILAWHLKVEMQPRRELWECSWGEWEGLRWLDLHEQHASAIQQREQNTYHFRPPGGESYQDAEQRLHPFLQEILRRHPVEPIALVAHGMLNRLIIRLLLQWSFEQVRHIRQDNQEIYHIHPNSSDQWAWAYQIIQVSPSVEAES